MTNLNAEKEKTQASEKLPIRCSVCGKKLLNIYPDTLPGVIFATCQGGHKISFRTGTPSRKAV